MGENFSLNGIDGIFCAAHTPKPSITPSCRIWIAPTVSDLRNWKSSRWKINIPSVGYSKCCPHLLILAVGRDTTSISRFASSSLMDSWQVPFLGAAPR